MYNPTRNFLLVEDDPGDIFLMERALARSEIANLLQIVTDGLQAIDYLSGIDPFSDREKCPLPHLIFLDLKLPYMHGFEVLKRIRAQPALDKVLVVVLTSSDEERDMQQAYRLGARSFLVKPPTAQMIKDLMQSLESHW